MYVDVYVCMYLGTDTTYIYVCICVCIRMHVCMYPMHTASPDPVCT